MRMGVCKRTAQIPLRLLALASLARQRGNAAKNYAQATPVRMVASA
jgi:hypothetical protein